MESRMRIATENEIAIVAASLTDAARLRGYRSEMLAHPIAGTSLRNYVILTECPELSDRLSLSDTDRFWSRYYWLARFNMEWNAIDGFDAGLEQQLVQLLEHAQVEYDQLVDVEAVVRRDAVLPTPTRNK